MGTVSSIWNNIRGILLIKKYEYFLTIWVNTKEIFAIDSLLLLLLKNIFFIQYQTYFKNIQNRTYYLAFR